MSRAFTRLIAVGLALLCFGVSPGVVAAQWSAPYTAFPEGPAEAWQTVLSFLAAAGLDGWLPAVGLALPILVGFAFLIRRLARRRKSPSTPVDGAESGEGREPPAPETALARAQESPEGPEVTALVAASGVPTVGEGEPVALGPASVGPPSAAAAPEGGEAAVSVEATGPLEEDRSRTAVALVAMGQEAARKGDREVAYGLIRQALETDPRNVDAWIWLAATTESPRESVICLKTALLLDPENPKAKRGLAYYQPQLDESGGEQ